MRSKTQEFSTWGGKLLQHTERLAEIQKQRRFRPITIQLAPTEACDSRCPFCSVANRPNGRIPFADICTGIAAFSKLGAKAVEITGGGNPLLYRDGSATISSVANTILEKGMKVGVITNSEEPKKYLNPSLAISWIRVSLSKLDEGYEPKDYDFSGFDGRLGLSYIIHSKTTIQTIRNIAQVVEDNPEVKFVRIAPDCTTDDALTISEKWAAILSEVDRFGKIFIKEIGSNYHPFLGGCWVGMIRPYWTSTGIYICTSHVLKTQKYEDAWRLCDCSEIESAWERMNGRFAAGLPPYEIDISKCWHCYYYNNNELLSYIIDTLPDSDFA